MRPGIFALLAVSAIALVGCGTSESSVQPTVTVTVPAETVEAVAPEVSAEDSVSAEEAYLSELSNNQTVEYINLTDKEALKYGREACSLAKVGKTVDIEMIGTTPEQKAASVVVSMAAEENLCPSEAN